MHQQNIYLDEEDENKKGCCRRCCSWQLCCIGILFLVILVLIGTVFLLYEIGFLFLAAAAEESEICQDDCLKSSVEISNFIDPSVSPCENFNDFVCGNYMKSPLPVISTPQRTLQDNIANELLNLIVGKPMENDEPAVLMQKHFFQVCNEVNRMDADEDKTLRKLIKKLGGWPLESEMEWREKKYYDWIDMMLDFKDLNLPFEWYMQFGIERNEINHLSITLPSNCEIFDAPKNYRKFMNSMVSNWTHNMYYSPDISKVLEMHNSLERICSYYSQTAKLTLEQAKSLDYILAKVDWYEVLTEITDGHLGHWNESYIAHNIQGYITQLDYDLIKIKKRTQVNFVIWKLIEYFSPYLSEPFRELHKDYTLERGLEYESRMWFCVTETQAKFPLVSEMAFIRQIVNEDVKEDVAGIVENVKDVLRNKFEESEVIDEETKSQFARKLDEIQVVIGGDDEIFNTDIFNEYLLIGNVSTKISDPIELLMEIQTAHWKATFSQLGKEASNFSRAEFYHLYTKPEPIYQVDQNTIVLPAAFLYDSMYNLDRSKFFNYATVGYHFARQLMHVFGTLGEPLLCVENSNETCMWTNSSWNNFQHRFELVQEKYENYLDPDLEEDSRAAILEELYADFTATTLAYDAYQKWVEENEEESALSGYWDYTPNQLFWMKLGMNWCVKKPDANVEIEEEGLEYQTDFRLNGPLQNSEQFNIDFHCVDKAPMNSDDKLSVF